MGKRTPYVHDTYLAATEVDTPAKIRRGTGHPTARVTMYAVAPAAAVEA